MPRPVFRCLCLCLGPLWAAAAPAAGPVQEGSLADFFGFDGLEVVRIGPNAGPLTLADLNGDDAIDLIVVNNHASRIELLYQKPDARPDDPVPPPTRVNKLPEHWRFERQLLSVAHRVAAVLVNDFDDDGLMDLIYAGLPGELVFVRQTSPRVFEVVRRHRVKGLAANRNAFAIADLIGGHRPELASLVDGEIHIWPLDVDDLGQPVRLAAGPDMVAFVLEDYNGDGRLDVAGIIPEDPAPVRLWLGSEEDGVGTLGPQVRFDLPPLREFEAVRLPGVDAASMAVIERASKRIVLYELASQEIEPGGRRDAPMLVHSFTDAGNRKRDVVVVDVNGDGLLDLVATDTEANAVVVYRQVAGKGLQSGVRYPSLSDLKYISGANVDDDPFAELFVPSEKESFVGRCDAGPEGIPFPKPLGGSEGYTPVAMNLVELEQGPHIAVVAKSGRKYVLDLINMAGERKTIDLGTQSRSPETIVALDADQNGRTDLLLFPRDKPMIMLYATDEGFELIESKDMGQFGLIKAATPDNTAVFDLDGNGHEELLLANRNFVRALRYVPDPPAGISPGWQVIEQINVNDSASELVSLAVLGRRLVVADKENERLVILAAGGASRRPGEGRAWREAESINVRGFAFKSIHAGSFSGDGQDNILAIGDDGFAVIRFVGERLTLREFAAWRTDEEDRLQHELAVGDVNGDGFTDLISLDAGEQMCEIFTFSESRRLMYAVGFQVFESKIFSGGPTREYEPSEVYVADVTGDGADDLILLAHDRVLIYPQTRP